jgi:diguanylate cyclase (GGDEF)-like protein
MDDGLVALIGWAKDDQAGRMPHDPLTTKKFPKVVPLDARVEPPAPRPPQPLSEPRVEPSTLDERPTLPKITISIESRKAEASDSSAVLTVLVGVNAGQVFSLDRDETVIGRGKGAHVQIDEEGISRQHARIHRSGFQYSLEDLGSTNGLLVNGKRSERAPLTDGDRIQLGPTLLLRFGILSADEVALARQLYDGSTKDALTQLYNRKYAGERLAAEVAYAVRHNAPLGIILFDIDHFKRVNDKFGHAAGDAVLRIVAAQSQSAVRQEDVLARYGGEEFIIIVRGIARSNVLVLAERVRAAIERLAIPWDLHTIRTTVSAGVAVLSECSPAGLPDALVALADERLYRAKREGRNRVCSSTSG